MPLALGVNKNVIMYGMRIKVKAYGHKLFVIALKYEGEGDYRFITATDLSDDFVSLSFNISITQIVVCLHLFLGLERYFLCPDLET